MSPCALHESSLSIGRLSPIIPVGIFGRQCITNIANIVLTLALLPVTRNLALLELTCLPNLAYHFLPARYLLVLSSSNAIIETKPGFVKNLCQILLVKTACLTDIHQNLWAMSFVSLVTSIEQTRHDIRFVNMQVDKHLSRCSTLVKWSWGKKTCYNYKPLKSFLVTCNPITLTSFFLKKS